MAIIVNHRYKIPSPPKSFWVKLKSGWILCLWYMPDQSPAMLAVVTPHQGGAGTHRYVLTHSSGAIQAADGVDEEGHQHFTVNDDEARRWMIRKQQLSNTIIGQ